MTRTRRPEAFKRAEGQLQRVRSDVYAKAARLVREGRVVLEDETELALWYRIRGDTGDHVVRLASDNHFSCTCAYASLKGPRALCSHVVAAILHRALAGGPDG